MTTLGKYSLKDFNDIADNGFTFKLPTDVYDTINYLCIQVGSSTLQSDTYTNTTAKIDSSAKEEEVKMKKKKGNKAMEVSEEEWESIRTFQPTKIEQKMGLDAEIDEIASTYRQVVGYITITDFAERVGVSVRTLDKYLRKDGGLWKS